MKIKSADGFFLTGEELVLLLMLHGVKQLYGFQIPALEGFTEQEAKQALFSLGQKGFAQEADGGIRLEAGLKKLVEQVAQADRVIHAKRQGTFPAGICLYIKESGTGAKGAVCLEALGETADLLRISYQEEIVSCLEEKGFLLEELLEDDTLFCDAEQSPELDWEEESWQTSLEMVDAVTGEAQMKLLLYKRPITDKILEITNEGRKVYLYSKRMLEERLFCGMERSKT